MGINPIETELEINGEFLRYILYQSKKMYWKSKKRNFFAEFKQINFLIFL